MVQMKVKLKSCNIFIFNVKFYLFITAFYCEDGLFSIDRLIDQVEMCRNLNFSPKVLILDVCEFILFALK